MADYNLEVQKTFLQFLISNEETFVRCRNIIDPSYFDASLRGVVKFVLRYADEYNAIPMVNQIEASTGVSIEIIEGIRDNHITWFLDEFEQFCRHRALENAILNAPDRLEKGLYADVEKEIKEAVLISLQKDLGTDYFLDPKARLEHMREKNGTVSTGWKTIDSKLFGGLNRGELTLFAGNAGMGKSLFLQNITLNWALAGLNVVYITLELSEELTSMRLDAMLSGRPTKDIYKNLDDVHLKVKMAGKKSGAVQVKYMSAGSSANDLKSYLKEYEIQTGIKPDALVIDYLDLLYPNNKKVNPSDMFIKDKFVSEELRALVAELGMLGVSASQLNRSAVDDTEHDIAHIAGGLSKVNTCDNLITLWTSNAMRERGEYRLQFIKTRSSSGVGSKVLLGFDPVTLRISDLPEDHRSDASEMSEIAEKIKNRSNTVPKPSNNDDDDDGSEPQPKVNASINSIKIKGILDRLNK